MISFLNNQYPSKVFMPALGVKKTTLHQWAERGYINLGSPGTGKSVILTGSEILYAACLVLLSKAGHSHKQMHLRGLRECIAFFKVGLEQRDDKELSQISDEYVLFKFVDRGHCLDAEWILSSGPFENKRHITEAFGDRAEPYLAAINLSDLTKRLVEKIDRPGG